MIDLEQEILALLHPKNIPLLESLGYELNHLKNKRNNIPLGTKIFIKLKHIPLKSRIIVKCICDYCGNEYESPYLNYNRSTNNALIKKDSCEDCRVLKQKESVSNLRKTISEIAVEFKNKNYTLLSSSIKNYDEKLEYICDKHKDYGIQSMSYHDFKFSGGCTKCRYEKMSESRAHDYDFIKDEYFKRDYLLVSKKYINSRKPLNFICLKHEDFGIQSIDYEHFKRGRGCYCCWKESITGENHHNWNGGNSEFKITIRSYTYEWKNISMKTCGYKCVVTGLRFDDIHHLYGFSLIFDEAMNNLNLDIRPLITDYSLDELESIKKEINILHSKYQIGVCLTHDIHSLFHSNYGRGNNTQEQFLSFISDLESGKFDDILKEKNIILNINKELINNIIGG